MEVSNRSCSAMLSRGRKGQFGVLVKEVENQLTVICGNRQGVLLECAHAAHSVTLCGLNFLKAAKNPIILFITFPCTK